MPRAVLRSSREVDSEGRLGIQATLPLESVREIQSGYRCIVCFEVQETAFPAGCSLCGYPIGDRQAEEFARQFAGGEDLWPTHQGILDDRMYEAQQHQYYARQAGVKTGLWEHRKSGLVVPTEEDEPPKPEYPEMTFEDFQEAPMPKGRWKRPFGSGT